MDLGGPDDSVTRPEPRLVRAGPEHAAVLTLMGPPEVDSAALTVRVVRLAGRLTIGRATAGAVGADDQLRLPDPLLSRIHAHLTEQPRGGGWHVEDAGSLNGTWLEGQRIK